MPIIDTYPDLPQPSTQVQGISMRFDILPTDYNSLIKKLWLPRLKVDGVEVFLKDEPITISETETEVAESLTVTLLDPEDRSLFAGTPAIEFGIGRRVGGAWDEATFDTMLPDLIVSSTSFTVSGPVNDPEDDSRITLITRAGDLLAKTSERGLIIYDSLRTQLSDADLRPDCDTDGNSYKPEVVAIPGLKWGDLRQEVLIERCGFSAVHDEDLKPFDYPIQRYQVKMGERFYDGLKGFLGVLVNPAITRQGDDLWITDTTKVQPSGFPAPRAITLDRPLSIETGSEKQRLDALWVNYTGIENNYDFTRPKFDSSDTSSGNQKTETEQIDIEFVKVVNPALPGVVVKTVPNIKNVRTFLLGTEIDYNSRNWILDTQGRVEHIISTVMKLLPPQDDVESAKILQKVLTETDDYIRGPHPFKPRTDIVTDRYYRSEGTVAVDSVNTNPDGSDFEMDYPTAFKSNNISTDHTFREGTIRTRTERAVPLLDGSSRVHIRQIYEVTGQVELDYSEDRPGEIGIPGYTPSQDRILVYKDTGAARSDDRVESISIGEWPLKYGIALARRILLQRQTDAGVVNVPILGYDKTLVKGLPIALYDRPQRGSAYLGAYLVTGRRITIDDGGVVMNLSGRVMASSEQPLQEVSSYGRTIGAGETLNFVIPIYCATGYSLFIAPTAVSNLTIMARPVELIPPAFTDLEADDISLTAYAGTVKNFEIEITAGAVSVVTHVEFNLLTDFTNAP